MYRFAYIDSRRASEGFINASQYPNNKCPKFTFSKAS